MSWILLGVGGLIALAGACALAPFAMSKLSVYAFAGPHNWMELRYLAAYLPTGAGRKHPYVIVAVAGTLLLAAAYAILVWAGRGLTASTHHTALASWQTALFVWLWALVWIRGARGAAGTWLPPALCAAAGLAWLSPNSISFAILYLHPLIALVFLYIAVRRWRPEYLRAYRAFSVLALALLLVLVIALSNADRLVPDSTLASRSTWRAGAGLVTTVPAHLLLSAHTFLETLHYAAWLVLIPMAGLRSKPWSLSAIPVAARSARGRRLVIAALVVSAGLVFALWLAFFVSPVVTFDVYFTVAMIHVIAELPCLLRLGRL